MNKINKQTLNKIYRTKDFIKIIQKIGYLEQCKKGGSHRIFKCPNMTTLSIPDGGKKVLSPGTKRNLMKLILGTAYYS